MMQGFTPNISSAIESDLFLKGKKYTQTNLGIVAKCSMSEEIPNGWRKLSRSEGEQIKKELNKMLDTWSIVAQ